MWSKSRAGTSSLPRAKFRMWTSRRFWSSFSDMGKESAATFAAQIKNGALFRTLGTKFGSLKISIHKVIISLN